MNATTTFLPNASSPWSVEGPSANTVPLSTLSPTLTIGLWYWQVPAFDNSKLAKYAGLYWKRNQSGEFDSQDKKSSKKSNKYLRYYLIEAAASCVRQGFPFIKDFYNIKYNEVTKHQHKRALVLSARKLERLIFGLLRKNQYYKPLNSVQNSKNI